jgi:hypothetical protein
MKRQVVNRFLKGASLLLMLYGMLELLSAVLWLFTPSGPPPFSFTASPSLGIRYNRKGERDEHHLWERVY